MFKPRCDTLIELMAKKNVPDADKAKEIGKLSSLLQKMEGMLKDLNSEYFSGNGNVSAVDILLHSELSTIVYMYSTKEKLNEQEYL